jgi:outer membrane protein OmpA-like peptidoglycan-associated protein
MTRRDAVTADRVRLQPADQIERHAASLAGSADALARARDGVAGRGAGPALIALARQVQITAGNHALGQMIARSPRGRRVARQLIATGDIDRFRALAEPASGLLLAHDPATNAITAVGSRVDPPTSPAFATQLQTIINDSAQHAEAQFGAAQAGVLVGGFPNPHDMTRSRVQRIDLDDIENIEAGAPGHGLAFLAHELAENYEAHSHVPAGGVDLLEGAHRSGIVTENAVLADIVGPGGRVARRLSVGAAPHTIVFIADYEFYFLVTDVNQVANDNQVTGAREAARVLVSTHTIDNFVTGQDAMPVAGSAQVSAALTDLVAHTQATAVFEGFTDDVGSSAVNDPLSQRRADAARAAMIGAGAATLATAMHTHGRGASRFVDDNTTEAGRARNRRVVIRIEEPAAP